MPLVLVISPHENSMEALPVLELQAGSVVRLSTVTEAQLYLAARQQDAPPVELILLQTESDQTIASACYNLRTYPLTATVPLITLLQDAASRQAVLAAGADDYLFLPLLPAEVEARLRQYLRSPLHKFTDFFSVINQFKRGITPRQIWEQGLGGLAEQWQATSAWVILLDQVSSIVTLAVGHNTPPFSIQEGEKLAPEIEKLLQGWLQVQTNLEMSGPHLIEAKLNSGTYQIIAPLDNRLRLLGLLVLSYPSLPLLNRFNKDLLAILSQNLANMLEMQQIQQETQIYATQNAFMLLIARTINQQFDLAMILALTLEQVIPLLNATGGEVWLLSADESWLEMASSLAAPSARQPLARRPSDKGLLGWVIQYNQGVQLATQQHDPRFDPAFDQREDGPDYSILAAPLRHRDQTIGVLAVYSQPDVVYTNQDLVLLSGIASLTASAIANARLLQRLREYGEQRQALYEMSQQIAAGLDLESTLNRILHWVGRLFNIEIALLWLIKESGEGLQLAAVRGIDPLPEQLIELPMGQGVSGWVAQTGEAVISNDPVNDPRPHLATLELLQLNLRGLIAAPMIYNGQTIGVLCLINKNEGLFTETDLTLLSTALEMIASAVGNARLHTQTITLIEERERLNRQLLQNERLATIGRLTGALSHEINNPMQAIRGALVLALEELDSPADLATYLQLCLEESDRVVQLLERLSQIYRPQISETAELLDVNQLLNEAIHLANKELKRKKISLRPNLSPNLPRVKGIANQLHLVFLSLLLNLSDAIGAAGGGELQLHSKALSEKICIELSTSLTALPIASWLAAFKVGSAIKEGKLSFGLSLSQDIIMAHGGQIELTEQSHWAVCTIELPIKI